jgi:hypothetical protein
LLFPLPLPLVAGEALRLCFPFPEPLDLLEPRDDPREGVRDLPLFFTFAFSAPIRGRPAPTFTFSLSCWGIGPLRSFQGFPHFIRNFRMAKATFVALVASFSCTMEETRNLSHARWRRWFVSRLLLLIVLRLRGGLRFCSSASSPFLLSCFRFLTRCG